MLLNNLKKREIESDVTKVIQMAFYHENKLYVCYVLCFLQNRPYDKQI